MVNSKGKLQGDTPPKQVYRLVFGWCLSVDSPWIPRYYWLQVAWAIQDTDPVNLGGLFTKEEKDTFLGRA